MKLEQERILQSSRTLQWIILRLPDFYGPDAELSYARVIFDAALRGRRAQLFAPADTPHQFAFTNDVGPIVADLLQREDGWNETYHFAGSGLITVDDFARQVYGAAGQQYRRFLVGPSIIRMLGMFQRMMREFAEMHYLHVAPVNLSDEKLMHHLGSVHRTSYVDGIRTTLEGLRAHPFAPLAQSVS